MAKIDKRFILNKRDGIISLRIKNSLDFSMQVPGYVPDDFYFSDTIAAIIHIYYVDLLPEILKYLKNIPVKTDLFISTVDEARYNAINYIIKNNYTNGSVTIKIFPNRGRDIAPTFIGFKHVFKEYKYFVHLHSKKSPHLKSIFKKSGVADQWRHYIFNSIMGSKEIVTSILWQLSNKDIGVVFAQHFPKIRNAVAWGNPEFSILQNLLVKSNIHVDINNYLEFPSGSMFWGKSAAILSLLEQNIKWEDFPEEKKILNSKDGTAKHNIDWVVSGTLAHAIERSILYYTEFTGYKWVKIGVRDQLKSPYKDNLLTYTNVQEFYSQLEAKVFISVLANRHNDIFNQLIDDYINRFDFIEMLRKIYQYAKILIHSRSS